MPPRLPSEWEPQDGVLLGWPHRQTDWADRLDVVEPIFLGIAELISRYEKLIIAAPAADSPLEKLRRLGGFSSRIELYDIPSDDTWARDYGPITVYEDHQAMLLDFQFNGWGRKYPAERDNEITKRLHEKGAFSVGAPRQINMVLEGGSIETEGQGTILTTSACLLNPKRNPGMNKKMIEEKLANCLGASRFLWLQNGGLQGDDTDSHIDTLVRFSSMDTLLYVRCDDPDDEHYSCLKAMEEELREFRAATGLPYRLVPLPWPGCVCDHDGRRLPATYANFLILNGAVLVPLYNVPKDAEALSIIGTAFPGRRIHGVDCSAIITQNGSLHCLTIHLPKGTLP